ncbi:MAG TPA: class I SAM-dependent methyltransferase [Pirellulales bacterium]|nr:class I SAM-dependent methyltransferase [Pirellulales bacterium]
MIQPNLTSHVAPRRHPPREDQFDGPLRPPRRAPPLDNGPRPIVPKLRDIRTLNLVYHIWPVASNDLWRWNITRLLPRINIFNGKRIVAIATDDETVSADEVIRELVGHGITFITMANDARLREGTTFLPLLDAVYTLDPTEATFYGHAKGVSRARSVHTVEKAWAECMYHHCLDFPDRAREALAHKAMYGVSFPIEKAWIYPGTFWWFHNASLFARDDWRTLENHVTREGVGWSVEAFPNRFFADDCQRVFPPELIYPPDRKFGLYDERIWTSDVRVPSLNERAKWRWGHAIEREWLTWGKILSGDSIVEAVARHATLEGARMLEIGPGYGRFMESLQKQRVRFGSFTGIDLSPQRSRELRRSFPEGRFVWGDIESFRDIGPLAPCDVIVATLVFKRLCPTFQLAATNCHWLLSPGGTLIFDVPETGVDWPPTEEAQAGSFEKGWGHGAFSKSYRREEICELLEASGFCDVRFDSIIHDGDKKRLLVIARRA